MILADDVKQFATLKSAEPVTCLMVHDVVNSTATTERYFYYIIRFYVMSATIPLKIDKCIIHIYEKQVLGFDLVF